ncbi:response regulator [Algoriphagus sp. AGSA1]|uniref:response regulator n=1 Tax=Algoriphagus sp. AGSA1 TaxID=2907213 RepID=UPI001F2BFF56|nr:response regulator [Algoriphagus sp. AGSA1]MCE7054782.1 response regulator [Algoriphagus sp. AGSA1]
MSTAPIKKILLLDDDKIQKILLWKRLTRINPGIEFVYFDRPSEALEYLRSESVDLLLVDLNLPEMDGWGFVDQMEKLRPDCRVILQTASVMEEVFLRAAQDSRIHQIFEKPLSESDLFSILGL